jgi:hypothetical protein
MPNEAGPAIIPRLTQRDCPAVKAGQRDPYNSPRANHVRSTLEGCMGEFQVLPSPISQRNSIARSLCVTSI